ncbi:MAG: hypothetical protein HZA09_07865, partial [Nitrospirae bacterium]|nr:hypothetical protein [Nitrospirota bacterium]
MDRYHRKENRHKVPELVGMILFWTIFMIPLWGDTVSAETQGREGKKIELEKVQILGILERPNVLFPIGWKDPEGPHEAVYKLKKSFKEEIFDFVDM